MKTTFDYNSLLVVPMEQWHNHGINLKAASIDGAGHVTSFLTSKLYGSRKYEFVNGAFTGKSWFIVKPR